MADPIFPLTNEWHAARRTHCTSTDVARIKRGEYYTVWAEKMGLLPGFAGNEFTEVGSALEEPLLRLAAKRLGCEIQYPAPMLIDPECRELSASPDAIRLDTHTGLECKTSASPAVAAKLGEAGSDELPDDWIWQTTSAMACGQWELTDVIVLLFGRLMPPYQVRRNDTLVAECRRVARELMQRVANNDPPPIDFASTANQDAVKALYGKPVIGKIIDLDAAAAEVWENRQVAAKGESEGKKKKEAYDAQMLAIMAGSEMGSFPDGSTLRRGTVTVKERIQPGYEYSRFWYKKG